MMVKRSSVLDTAANIVTIVTGISIVAFLAWMVVVSRAAAKQPSRTTYQMGERIDLQGNGLENADRTLLMVVNSACQFCTASMPFYRDLASHRSPSRRMVALSIEPTETTESYLRSHGVSVDKSIMVARGTLKVSGTPTLILIDRKGTAEKVWHGRLDGASEADVFASWGSTSAASNVR